MKKLFPCLVLLSVLPCLAQDQDNATRMSEILGRLAADGLRVAVFPEGALTRYDQAAIMRASAGEIAAAEERIRLMCRERKIAAIFGSVYKINGRTYNTAVVFDSRGELIDRYAKLYLASEKWFTPGNHISFFDLEGIPSTVMICADEIHPELVRLPAIQGARVVYYISSESGRVEAGALPRATDDPRTRKQGFHRVRQHSRRSEGP